MFYLHAQFGQPQAQFCERIGDADARVRNGSKVSEASGNLGTGDGSVAGKINGMKREVALDLSTL